jgi:ferric-dicitrate binding protein FerR (iron transport regulator)
MTEGGDFENLVNRYMDGMATADEVARLNEMLRTAVEARRAFSELLNLDSALAALAAEGTLPTECPSPATSVLSGGNSGAAPRSRKRFASWTWLAGGSVAAAIVVAVMFATITLTRKNPLPAEATIARLTDASEAVWADGAISPTLGDRLGTESLRLKSGTVQITTDAGVLLRLVGPVEAEFVDPMRFRVRSGKVTAEVSPAAKGFSIDTAQAQIVDLGTKFGVDASQAGHTDIMVLQGKVQVLNKQPGSVAETLTTGQAVRVDKSRRLCRIINVTSDGREEDWSTHGILPSQCVITAVRDNMEGAQPSLRNFYRIVPGGMREDARAYADSFHEWNGLDAKGMPARLLGADLVQTFNADNVNWFMQITVSTSRPCMFYVLADRRNPPPAWLRERFTDTGVNIACEYVDPQYKIFPAKGPGKGRTLLPFGVWKLEVPKAGEVKLGPPYFEKFRDASTVRPNFMYGIAAKPLP